MDYQNRTMGETLRLCQALTFRFPLAMVEALETMADFSASQLQLWWRAFYAPSGGLMNAVLRSRASAAEVDALALDIEQIRSELRSVIARLSESDGAAAARFDRLRDEITALREQFKAALVKKSDSTEVQHLHAELGTLRDELRSALAERESAPPAATAAALADLQKELRALRDRMGSEPKSMEQETPGKGSRPGENSARKRPRR